MKVINKLFYLYSKFFKKIIRGKCVINSEIHPTAVINSGSEVVNCKVGKYTYIGYDSNVINCEIGSFCSIAQNFSAGNGEHPMEWVSTSPVFENVGHSGPRKRFAKHDLPPCKTTTIGNDVWIGANVIIKQGVRVGNGAVIGSGAVVTKNVPPYAVVAGVSAKIIRLRFNNDIIDALEKSKWWELSDKELEQVAWAIKNPSEFIVEVNKFKSRS